MIAIGIQFGGPEHRNGTIRWALMSAMRTAASVRPQNYEDGTEGWINPIFVVPGSLLKPEFQGYEVGHFSSKKKGLVVKVAVPTDVANGQDVELFVGHALREVVRIAAKHFSSKRTSFSTLRAEKIIVAIEAVLENGGQLRSE